MVDKRQFVISQLDKLAKVQACVSSKLAQGVLDMDDVDAINLHIQRAKLVIQTAIVKPGRVFTGG